jgi:hypothetical protein
MVPGSANRSAAILSFPSYLSMWKNLVAPTTPGGAVVNDDEQRRTAFVDLEMAAVWQGHQRGVVTGEEVRQRLDELERLLWRRVLGRLRKLAPGAALYVGFPAVSAAAGPAGEAAAGGS